MGVLPRPANLSVSWRPAEALGFFYDVYAFRVGEPEQRRVAILFNDISMRKQEKEVLQEFEQEHSFHAAILESIRDPLWVSDPGLRIVYWNDAAAAAFGWTADEVRGRHTGELFKTLVPGSNREDAVSKALQKGDFFGEVVVQCKDGHTLIAEASSRAVYGPDGEVVRLVNTVRDITERKRDEIEKERLRKIAEEQLDRMQALMESLPVGVWIADADGKLIMTNKAAADVYGGLAPLADNFNEYAVYKAFWLNTAEQVPVERFPLIRALNGETVKNMVLDHERFDGTRGTHISSSVPIRGENGDITGGVAVAMDISKLREAEGALRKSEARFRSLVTASSDVVYSMSPDWKELRYLQGKNFIRDTDSPSNSWLDNYFHPDDQTQVMDMIHEAIRAKDTFELEHRVLCSDGTLGWTFSRAVPILDENGEITEWIGAASDITARKQAEESLQKSHDALEKSIEMKDEFLSLISHEFRTPLTVIISAIQMLKKLSWDELSDKAKGYFNTIRQNSNRQLKLVNNILDISRINAGRFQIHITNSDILQLTNRIIESIKPYAERKKIRLSFSFAPVKIISGIDVEKYERILLNLLSNAIKYTPKGESITVKLSRKIVNKRAMACIQVCDNGIGIPSDKHEHIFERFGQVDSVLSRQAEGTGIGLHLTRMFVEMLGGEIFMHSKLGVGSTFTVLLPITKTKETQSEKIAHESADNRTIQLTEVEFSDVYFDK